MVKMRHRILLSPITKYFVATLIVGMVFSASTYIIMTLVLDNVEDSWLTTCNIKPNYQVKCLPGKESNYETCSMVGCCWSDKNKNCYHSLPSRHGYYYDNDTNADIHQGVHLIPRREYSPLGSRNLASLYFDVTLVDPGNLQLTLKRGGPKIKSSNASDSLVNSGFTVLINSPAFSITVLRDRSNSTKIHLLNTALGPLIVTNTYWEWSIHMTNITLYGLESTYIRGATHWLYNNAEHSKIPAFFGITLEGETFAWYVRYSGPMEIQVLGDSNLIVLKGMSLPEEISLRIIADATPQQTMKQLYKSLEEDGYIMKMDNTMPTAIVAASLGLHVCPDLGYTDESIEESLNNIIATTAISQIPWDTHCLHRQFCFTLDTILNETEMKLLVRSKNVLKDAGKQLVPHLTPMLLEKNNILLSELEESSLLLKNSSQTYLGSYHGTSVIYPEWSDNKTYEILQNSVTNFTNNFGTSKLVIIRDAWPKDDTNAHTDNFSQFDYMPQELGRLMTNGTIPYDLTSTVASLHYTAHNVYANKFRAFILRNAYSLSSANVLPHESNDAKADRFGWVTFQATIDRAIGSGLVGQLPPVIYVCNSHTSPYMSDELCTRWYGAAVVFPFVMTIPEHLPGGSGMTVGSSRYAKAFLELRAKFITYQYTVIEEYYDSGQPVLAPVQFYYPLEPLLNETNNINQFFWGSSLLIGVVSLPNTRQLQMRIPGDLPWRHLGDGIKVSPSGTKTVSIPATEGQIVILVRPGHIIPMHENISMTSAETIRSGIELVANLACYEENNCMAQGRIAYGSEIFLSIAVNETVLTFMNILRVKSHACTTTVENAILIKSLTVLGDQSRYRHPLDFNICNNTEDVVDDKHDIIISKY